MPPLSESELLSSALWTRHSTIGAAGPSGDADLDNQVWLETQEEVLKASSLVSLSSVHSTLPISIAFVAESSGTIMQAQSKRAMFRL